MNDARPVRRPAAGRAFVVVASAIGVIGAALVGVALWPGDDGPVSLDATPVVAGATPSTLPPIEPEETPISAAPTGDEPVGTSPAPPPPAADLSPLAGLLGDAGSAVPPPLEARARPRSITIDDLDLWGPIRPVGLEENGELEVPDETEVGWYRYGSTPGRAGATVLAAHVTWNGTIGPFYRLRDLDPGALVEVRLDDGSSRTYEVVERTIYDKDELPRDRIWRNTGDETLVLITCGGSFNPDINRYRENVVVYAVPVASEPGEERATS